MRNSFFNRRIPTLLAILLLLGGLGLTSYLANITPRLTSLASPDETPQDLRVSAVSDSGFTVSYTTSKPVLGSLAYGTSSPTNTVLDIRDSQSGSPKNYTTHEITVEKLAEKTKYVFSITSGSSTFQDNGNPFSVTTGPKLTDPPKAKTITGTVLSLDGKPAADVLVYVTTNNGQQLVTLTNGQGGYTLPLAGMRTTSLDSYFPLSDDAKMSLIAKTNDALSQASFLLVDPSVPQITLSENYDFTLGREILLPSPGAGTEDTAFPIFQGNPTESAAVSITSPTSQEAFSDHQPEFSGSAAPKEIVDITIQSTEQKATVTTDALGAWTYRPQTPLEPGEHTITIETRDNNGILRRLSRSFVVLAEGSQFTEPSVSPVKPSSSPSPTLQPTLEPSATPTVSPTATPLATRTPDTPVGEISPTSELAALPTTEPLPTLTPRPSVQPTGSNDLNIIGLISFTFIILGGILLLFTRGIIL
jgi:hypothetical protein